MEKEDGEKRIPLNRGAWCRPILAPRGPFPHHWAVRNNPGLISISCSPSTPSVSWLLAPETEDSSLSGRALRAGSPSTIGAAAPWPWHTEGTLVFPLSGCPASCHSSMPRKLNTIEVTLDSPLMTYWSPWESGFKKKSLWALSCPWLHTERVGACGGHTHLGRPGRMLSTHYPEV